MPALTVTLSATPTPDLSQAESVRIVGVQGYTLVIDDTDPTIDDTDTNVVTHDWVDGETDLVGRIWVNVIVDWGSTQQTFPPYGSLAVDVGATELIEAPA